MMCGVVCLADTCEMTSSARFFSCEDGIKRGHASLIRHGPCETRDYPQRGIIESYGCAMAADPTAAVACPTK